MLNFRSWHFFSFLFSICPAFAGEISDAGVAAENW
jgi:hypothetical protein